MKNILIIAALLAAGIYGEVTAKERDHLIETEVVPLVCKADPKDPADIGAHYAVEYKLPEADGVATRIDCYILRPAGKSFAIEADFGHKWAESIGQALFYSARTGAEPGVILIRAHNESETQYARHWRRLSFANSQKRLGLLIICVEPDASHRECPAE